MAIYAKIENGILACRDDSIDGFDAVKAAADGFVFHNVPSEDWLRDDGTGTIIEKDPTVYPTQQMISTNNQAVKAVLREIDIESIRAIREWLAKQPTAPQFILDHESAAQAERAKLK